MDYTTRPAIGLRRIGQRLGVLRPLQRRYRRWFGGAPEVAFDRALRDTVKGGDTVWDVGAHVGAYTTTFAELVGPSGRVVAFEPSPVVLGELTKATASYDNVVIVDAALSDVRGTADFFRSDVGPTSFHGLSADGSDHELSAADVVRTERGDELAKEHPPNVIKIDVEGFELEVLRGLGLENGVPELHTIAVEVHFQTLMRRGLEDAPRRILQLLESAGFTVRWTDPSHLVATRHPSAGAQPTEPG